MPPKEKDGRIQICAWLELPKVMEIDKRVAELQIGQAAKVHRSDILKMIIDEWIQARSPKP